MRHKDVFCESVSGDYCEKSIHKYMTWNSPHFFLGTRFTLKCSCNSDNKISKRRPSLLVEKDICL